MSTVNAAIALPVDLTNPGHFFACCGLFEVADRLWHGSEAWFSGTEGAAAFQIAASNGEAGSHEARARSLEELLTAARDVQFDLGKIEGGADDSGEEEPSGLSPIIIESPFHMLLDWWGDKSIKPWAGSMNERLILRAMLSGIDTANRDPLNDSTPVYDPVAVVEPGKREKKPKKREPFYFDCRRGSNAHPLDSGFSPDTHHLESCCFPAVEAMCFIGLQRARPAPTDVANRSTYTVWTTRIPVTLVGPVVCGVVGLPGSSAFTFDNFFRTDQRKHKSYSRATRERIKNV